MQFPFFLILLSGGILGASTLAGRYANVAPSLLATLVMLATGLLGVATFPSAMPHITNGRGAAIALFSGLLNGVGVMLFYRLIGGSGPGTWQLSSVVPATVITMCLSTMIGSWALFGEALTWQRASGAVLAVAAIWLLR